MPECEAEHELTRPQRKNDRKQYPRGVGNESADRHARDKLSDTRSREDGQCHAKNREYSTLNRTHQNVEVV